MVNQMIKLIPHKYLEKEELINNLMNGRRYTRADTLEGSYAVLHWDKAHIRSPFRYGLKPWDWRGMSELKEITETHWYDEASGENPIPCHVHDGEEVRQIDYITDYKKSSLYPYQGIYDAYKSATPILPSECYQEPV